MEQFRKLKGRFLERWGRLTGDRSLQRAGQQQLSIADLLLSIERLQTAHDPEDYQTTDALAIYAELLKVVEKAKQIRHNEVRTVLISRQLQDGFQWARETLGDAGPDWKRVLGVPISPGPRDQERLWVIELHHFMRR